MRAIIGTCFAVATVIVAVAAYHSGLVYREKLPKVYTQLSEPWPDAGGLSIVSKTKVSEAQAH
ncbi:MAG: hypothetical protein KGI70_00555 [Patescibacteria group bacterium]|nr:hypothetical protein [Patescibacteria group bacterium]